MAKYEMEDLYNEQIRRLSESKDKGEPWIIITISNLKKEYYPNLEEPKDVPTYQRRNIVNYLCLDPFVSYRFREETRSRYRAKEYAYLGPEYKLKQLLDEDYAQFDLGGDYKVSNVERFMRSKLQEYMNIASLKQFYTLGSIYEILYNQNYANGPDAKGEYSWKVLDEVQLAKLVNVSKEHIRQYLNILKKQKLLLVNRYTLDARLITSDEEYEKMSNILLTKQAADSKNQKTNTIKDIGGHVATEDESDNKPFEYIKEGVELQKNASVIYNKIREVLVLCDKQQKQIDSLQSRDAQYREDITGLSALQLGYNELAKENDALKNNPLSAPQMVQIQQFVSSKLAEMAEKLDKEINYQIGIMKSDPKYCTPDNLREYQTILKNIIFDSQYNRNILSGFEFKPENNK